MQDFGWVAWVLSGISAAIAIVAPVRSGRAVSAAELAAASSDRSADAAEGSLELERGRDERERLGRSVKVRAELDPRKAGVYMLVNFGTVDAEQFQVEVVGD